MKRFSTNIPCCLNVSTIHCASFSNRCSPSDGSTFVFRSTWHIRAYTASIEIHGKSYHSIRSNVCQAAYIDFRTNLTQWLDVVLDESCWTVVSRSKSTRYTVARIAVNTMMLHCALYTTPNAFIDYCPPLWLPACQICSAGLI